MTSSHATDAPGAADRPVPVGSPAARTSAMAERLRRAGLRVTSQRLAVLQTVAEHPHSTADQVLARVCDSPSTSGGPTDPAARTGISRQAVYDVLTAGVTAGLLRRIEPAGSPARYETRAGDNHHHLICRACGHTVDVDCTVGTAPCLQPFDAASDTPRPAGFRIDEAEIVFWGWCADCDRDRSTADPSP